MLFQYIWHFFFFNFVYDLHYVLNCSRTGCTEDCIQFYKGATVSSRNLIRFYGTSEGRFSNREESMSFSFGYDKIVTVYYHTNGRTIRSDVTGLRMSYDLRGKLSCLLLGHIHSKMCGVTTYCTIELQILMNADPVLIVTLVKTYPDLMNVTVVTAIISHMLHAPVLVCKSDVA